MLPNPQPVKSSSNGLASYPNQAPCHKPLPDPSATRQPRRRPPFSVKPRQKETEERMASRNPPVGYACVHANNYQRRRLSRRHLHKGSSAPACSRDWPEWFGRLQPQLSAPTGGSQNDRREGARCNDSADKRKHGQRIEGRPSNALLCVLPRKQPTTSQSIGLAILLSVLNGSKRLNVLRSKKCIAHRIF